MTEESSPYEVMDHFTPRQAIGSGTFGTVWRMDWHRPNGPVLPVAIKRVRMQHEESFPEHQLVDRCAHPNVISLYDSFYSYNANGEGHLNLIFEFVSGQNLLEAINEADEDISCERALHILKQLLKALEYLHEKGIAHRDLKPANIMLREDGLVKIIDFGHAKHMEDPNGGRRSYSTCYCVSRYYRAPELLLGNIHYGVKLDIWSIGCILGEMLLGSPIFPGEDEDDQFLRIVTILGAPSEEDVRSMMPYLKDVNALLNQDEPFVAPLPLSIILPAKYAMFADILACMLVYNPEKRWSARELLNHPLFSETTFGAP